MCKPFFSLLLLFPLAVKAQQPQSDSELTAGALFVAEDAVLVLASGTDDITIENTLPNAPEPWRAEQRTANDDDDKDALLTGVYEQRVPKPERPLAGGAVWNKKFVAVHAAFLGSIVYDTELTHQGIAHHNCAEANPNLGSHPSRGKIYRQNIPAFSAVSGLDWVTAKTGIPYLPYIGPVVGTVVHLTAGSKWLGQCW
ncbi:MAG: hypothetical protein WB562_04875 [Candidatus Sulfotelmatobacter sp.]